MGRFTEIYKRKIERLRAAAAVVKNIPSYPDLDRELIKKLDGACVTVSLGRGQVALVDLADEPLIRAHRWYYRFDRFGHWYTRGQIKVEGKLVHTSMHRFLTGALPGQVVDHINGDGLDNRRCNLRVCTNKQNIRNARPYTGKKTSKFRGVYFNSTERKFRAQIMCSGVKINLGCFVSEKSAAEAYDEAASKLFGEYARLNFPKANAA